MAVIRCDALSKRYGDTYALRDLDLDVAEGEVLGFLGPNGAGKTTTIRLLLGLIRPTSGRAERTNSAAARSASPLRSGRQASASAVSRSASRPAVNPSSSASPIHRVTIETAACGPHDAGATRVAGGAFAHLVHHERDRHAVGEIVHDE